MRRSWVVRPQDQFEIKMIGDVAVLEVTPDKVTVLLLRERECKTFILKTFIRHIVRKIKEGPRELEEVRDDTGTLMWKEVPIRYSVKTPKGLFQWIGQKTRMVSVREVETHG